MSIKMNKPIREFVEHSLNQKVDEANENDFGRKAYLEKENAVRKQAEDIIEAARKELLVAFIEHGLTDYSGNPPTMHLMEEYISDFHISRIRDFSGRKAFEARADERRKKVKQIMQDIELEFAFGSVADAETFKAKLAQIQI